MRPPRRSLRLRMETPEVLAGHAELRQDIEDAIARGLLPAVDAGLLTAAMVGVGVRIVGAGCATEPMSRPPAPSPPRLFLGGIAALPRFDAYR